MSKLFSEKFKQLRTINQISQKELAQEFKVSTNTIHKWENGTEPTFEKLEEIADYFQTDINELLCYSIQPTPKKIQAKPEYQILYESLNQFQQAEVRGYMKRISSENRKENITRN